MKIFAIVSLIFAAIYLFLNIKDLLSVDHESDFLASILWLLTAIFLVANG